MKRILLWLLLVLDRLSTWIENMANSYYTPSGVPATQTRGSSLNIRAEFAAVEDGFDAVETAMNLKAPKAAPQFTGNALFGSTSARTMASIVPTVQVEGTSAANGSVALIVNNASTTPGYLHFAKSRAAAVGGFDIVQSGDRLGGIVFCGADGTDIDTIGALILANVDGTPGVNDMPGRLTFATSADGSGSPTERLRINCTGNVLVGLTSAVTAGAKLQTVDGISFPATAVASSDPNTLDDYQEGTWTPVLDSWTNVGSPTVDGWFVKIGRLVTLGFSVTPATSASATAGVSGVSGFAASTGLPAKNAVGGCGNAANAASFDSVTMFAGVDYLYMPTTGVIGPTGTIDVTIQFIV